MSDIELESARALFERAEKEHHPTSKFEFLQEALDLVEDYLCEHAELDRELSYARNLRHSYLRILLTQLTAMQNIDIEQWFKYTHLLVIRCGPDVQSILAENPSLTDSYQAFMDVWKKELLAMLEQP